MVLFSTSLLMLGLAAAFAPGSSRAATATRPRIVVLGLSLIVIAFQAFFSAFLLGVLEIPVKRLKAGQANRSGESVAPAEK